MASVEEVPLTETPEASVEAPEPTVEPTSTAEPEPVQAKPKAKAKAKMGRPTGSKDVKPRAKPKPKIQRKVSIAPRQEYYDDSESSADEATLQELQTLQLIRSVRAFDAGKISRKNQMYANWFGR